MQNFVMSTFVEFNEITF